MQINKTLKGLIVQDTNADYKYSLPQSGINSSQNAISSANFEEVFINCVDTTSQVKLPAISDFRRGFSPKIYVYNSLSLGNINVLGYYNEETEQQDDVNGNFSLILPPSCTGYFHIVNNNNWACWVTPTFLT